MPVLFLDCHLPHNTPHIPSRYNNEQATTKKSYKQLIYRHISCKCDTNRAGHFTLDTHASRPVAWCPYWVRVNSPKAVSEFFVEAVDFIDIVNIYHETTMVTARTTSTKKAERSSVTVLKCDTSLSCVNKTAAAYHLGTNCLHNIGVWPRAEA